MLTSLQLNPAQVELISGFIDTYLKLNSQEEVVFQEELATIEPREKEKVMQIVTSWMQKGLEQGEKQGELKLLMRQLNRRLGEISH